MPRKLTHEEFMGKFNTKNTHAKDIEILGTYINNKTKILCKCKLHGYEWSITPSNLLNGQGCPICGYETVAQKKTKTHEQFIKELHQINQDIEILGRYVTNSTKIKCKCKKDGYEWEARPDTLLRGIGCPKCSGKIKDKTTEYFINELKEINDNIEILGEYKGCKTKIKCKCKLDGYEWEAIPSDLLKGHGCPKCGRKTVSQKLNKTHEQFIQDLHEINPDIEILGTYINNRTKIKCKCKLDGHIWETTPNKLLNGSGCPKCNITKGEKRVAQYLDNLNIPYIYDKCYFKDLVGIGGGLLRPDFIIPSLKIWIEYDGIQHFEPVDFTSKMSEQEVQEQFIYTQQNDQIKNQYAQDHDWTLIRIPYYDYDNIEQILDNYIKEQEQQAI